MSNPESCVVATYTVYDTFKIPKDIDLNSPDVKWFIRYRVLHIETAEGEEYEIDAEDVECDYKTPDDVTIEDADNWNVVYTSDEQTSETSSEAKEESSEEESDDVDKIRQHDKNTISR